MLSIFTVTFILIFAVYSEQCIPAAATAVQQFLFSVLPSIYPFYVASYILRQTSFCKKLSDVSKPIMRPLFAVSGAGAFAVIIGAVSGYPAGARVSADLYKEGLITKDDVVNLSAFTNNTGPLFIIGAVGVGMLGSFKCGITLWFCHIISSLLTGILICNLRRIYLKRRRRRGGPDGFEKTELVTADFTNTPAVKKDRIKPSLGRIVSEAMTGSMYTMIPIAAAVIFFAAFNAAAEASGLFGLISEYLLGFMPREASVGVIKGFFEITGGISSVASADVGETFKMAIISGVAGLAGVSVYFQVAGIYSECRVSSGFYIIGKAAHGIIAFLLALIVF